MLNFFLSEEVTEAVRDYGNIVTLLISGFDGCPLVT